MCIRDSPKCVQLAKYYGATDVLSYKEGDIVQQVKELTNGKGVDATIIAGGTAEVLTQAYDMTRYGIGTISNINYFGGTGYLPLPICLLYTSIACSWRSGIRYYKIGF